MFTAQNVSEACLLLQEKPIDVIVSDINMPRLKEIDLLHMIREEFREIQAIMITGLPSMYSAIEDTRASFIINALDENERMSFIQKQVGHTTTQMIVAT